MERKIFEAAVWAFAKSGQYEKALNATFKFKEGLNLSKQLFKYYLRQMDLLNCRKLSAGDWTQILEYFKAALEVAEKIYFFQRHSRYRKEVIMKGLEYLQKPNAPVEELVEFLYETRAGFDDVLIKTVIKIYLSIPQLGGAEILKITQLMMSEERLPEVKKLVPIFIKRGDYEALELIRKNDGKFGDEIISQSEQIILSCLRRGRIENAAGAVSLIPDDNKRQKYCMLLGVDFVPNGSDVSDAEEKIN